MISGKTRVCGVFGCPAEHSMSPLMHNYFAAATGLDLTYAAFRVEPEHLGEAVRGAYAMNLLGVNITVPHKLAVMEYCKEIDEGAAVIGAVNTLVRVDGGFRGYNTDAGGLLRAMQNEGIAIADRTCILLGAGGAARAAAYILAREGAKKIYCLNRSLSRAQALSADMNAHFGRSIMMPLSLAGWEQIPENGCLAVQTTSVGMYPQTEASPVTDPRFFKKLSAAVDIIYTPSVTRFMSLAAESGARTVSGLSMLIYQGITAFELWNPGVKVPEAAAAEAQKQIRAFLEDNGR